jgi:exodeoxyribonuclease VII small subunit
VPAAPKTTAHATTARDNPSFEEALEKLESIVDAMESGDLPLDTLLARFEEGVKLVKTCQSRLEEAELRIQKLEKNSFGEPVLQPLTKANQDDE